MEKTVQDRRKGEANFMRMFYQWLESSGSSHSRNQVDPVSLKAQTQNNVDFLEKCPTLQFLLKETCSKTFCD